MNDKLFKIVWLDRYGNRHFCFLDTREQLELFEALRNHNKKTIIAETKTVFINRDVGYHEVKLVRSLLGD